jgi:hypothetical protein
MRFCVNIIFHTNDIHSLYIYMCVCEDICIESSFTGSNEQVSLYVCVCTLFIFKFHCPGAQGVR